MIAEDLPLPDDLDLLKSMVRAMAQKTVALEDENAALQARSSDADERIKRLMQILKAYDRARFGRRHQPVGGVGGVGVRLGVGVERGELLLLEVALQQQPAGAVIPDDRTAASPVQPSCHKPPESRSKQPENWPAMAQSQTTCPDPSSAGPR